MADSREHDEAPRRSEPAVALQADPEVESMERLMHRLTRPYLNVALVGRK